MRKRCASFFIAYRVGGHGVELLARPQLRSDRDPLAGGASLELLTQLDRGGHRHGLQLVADLPTCNDRRTARNAQNSDHLDVAGTGLRSDRGLAGEHLAGCGFGVDRIRLAGVAAQLAVEPLDLDHDHTTVAQPAAQSRAVGPSALDSDHLDGAE